MLVPCPTCRRPAAVPKGGAEAFPTNFIVQNIIEELGGGTAVDTADSPDRKPTCGSCESYGKPGEAVCQFILNC